MLVSSIQLHKNGPFICSFCYVCMCCFAEKENVCVLFRAVTKEARATYSSPSSCLERRGSEGECADAAAVEYVSVNKKASLMAVACFAGRRRRRTFTSPTCSCSPNIVYVSYLITIASFVQLTRLFLLFKFV